MPDPGTIIQGLGGLGILGFIGTVIKSLVDRKKANTDSVQVVTSTAVSLLKPMRTELAEMEKDLKDARNELKKAIKELADLNNFVRNLLNEMSGYRELTSAERKYIDGKYPYTES